MTSISLGDTLPNIELHATGDQTIQLSELAGEKLVLYFYPKDSTPGCTQEGLDFSENYLKFKRSQCLILGVSRDTLAKHEKFKEKQEFKFNLLSDPDEILCTVFDVIKMKNMYGKQVRGIERSTFLFNADGTLAQEWRKVKVKGHVDDVLAAVKTL
ncbi:MAG: peroxiredoxin [Gammaproteobacteria bacterium]|nr:peroxiredoxin [Gammaproteobacteria bacterium]